MPYAATSVAAARAAGMRFAYVTNNASRSPATVAAKLTALDMPTDAAEVVTSAQAAARTLAEHLAPGAAVLVVGTDALADEVRAVGLRPVRTVDEAPGAGPAAVVQGLAPTTSWADLAEAAVALHRESVARVGAQRPLVVGDRLDTDVLGAVRGGADSLLVLTGVVGLRELAQAPKGSRPTYVARDLRGLLHPHPEVEVNGETARCGDAVARVERGAVTCADQSEDAVRALAALAWACADRGVHVALGDP